MSKDDIIDVSVDSDIEALEPTVDLNETVRVSANEPALEVALDLDTAVSVVSNEQIVVPVAPVVTVEAEWTGPPVKSVTVPIIEEDEEVVDEVDALFIAAGQDSARETIAAIEEEEEEPVLDPREELVRQAAGAITREMLKGNDPIVEEAPDKYEERFAAHVKGWEARIRAITNQAPPPKDFRDAAGGSTKILEDDQVLQGYIGDQVDRNVLAFDDSVGKFAANSIGTVLGGGDEAFGVFIQNTAPTTSLTKYLWIQTSVNGVNEDATWWYEDNLNEYIFHLSKTTKPTWNPDELRKPYTKASIIRSKKPIKKNTSNRESRKLENEYNYIYYPESLNPEFLDRKVPLPNYWQWLQHYFLLPL